MDDDSVRCLELAGDETIPNICSWHGRARLPVEPEDNHIGII